MPDGASPSHSSIERNEEIREVSLGVSLQDGLADPATHGRRNESGVSEDSARLPSHVDESLSPVKNPKRKNTPSSSSLSSLSSSSSSPLSPVISSQRPLRILSKRRRFEKAASDEHRLREEKSVGHGEMELPDRVGKESTKQAEEELCSSGEQDTVIVSQTQCGCGVRRANGARGRGGGKVSARGTGGVGRRRVGRSRKR